MSWWYRNLLRPALFAQEPEAVHNRTMRALNLASRRPTLGGIVQSLCSSPPLPVDAFGLTFRNPVGLAAGMDKNAEALPAWAKIGFGFTELGAVTWLPQPGNDQPRVFRAVDDLAIVNRMGFNNAGADAVAAELGAWRDSGLWPSHHPVGINLGKSKIIPLETAAEDYTKSFTALWPHADFFVVNVSSPNTPNLRELQDKAALSRILSLIQDVNQKMAIASGQTNPGSGNSPSCKPVLVKVAPDLTYEAIDEILELCPEHEVAGIIATNTTTNRPHATSPKLRQVYSEAGGLSGRPLRHRSTEVIRHIAKQTRGGLPVIGVGGVFNADDAWEKITAGALLIQVYTGLVYEGPTIARQIVEGLIQKVETSGFKSLREAVGTAVK